MGAFDYILPLLTEVADLIKDETVTEICLNQNGDVYFERHGELVKHVAHVSEEYRMTAALNIATVLGQKDFGKKYLLLDARLEDGSRVAAALPPASVGGAAISIRKFRHEVYSLGELVRMGMMSSAVAASLRATVTTERRNVLISGGTSTGKSTLLNALANILPKDQRIVLIEDTSELRLSAENLVRFEVQKEGNGMPAVTMTELLRSTLRFRPDRIIVGEVRGDEAFDLLQALNTGHQGSMSTVHANSTVEALERLTALCASGRNRLAFEYIARAIAQAIHVVVHVELRNGQRRVAEVASVVRYKSGADEFEVKKWS